jgi:hypothetical protein
MVTESGDGGAVISLLAIVVFLVHERLLCGSTLSGALGSIQVDAMVVRATGTVRHVDG